MKQLKRLLNIILILITLSSCEFITNEEYIHPDLVSYYYQFYAEAERLGIHPQRKEIYLDFGYTDGRNGYSKNDINSGRGKDHAKIIINREFYDNNIDRPWNIECLVFHELGHGVLNRPHFDMEVDSIQIIPPSVIEGKVIVQQQEILQSFPLSIMHSGGGGGDNKYKYYKNNREYYLKELFGTL